MRVGIRGVVSSLSLATAAGIGIGAALFSSNPVLLLSAATVVFFLTLIGSLAQLSEPDSSPAYKEGFQDGKETALKQVEQDESPVLVYDREIIEDEEEEHKRKYIQGFIDGFESIIDLFGREENEEEEEEEEEEDEEQSDSKEDEENKTEREKSKA
jgi:hypothetical protein